VYTNTQLRRNIGQDVKRMIRGVVIRGLFPTEWILRWKNLKGSGFLAECHLETAEEDKYVIFTSYTFWSKM